MEGKARSKIPFKEIWNSHLKQGYKGLESIQDLEKRVFSFLDELKEWSDKNPGKNVLVVSHGGVGCIVMSYFMGRPKNGDYLSFELPHGGKPLILDFKDIVKQTDLTDNKTM